MKLKKEIWKLVKLNELMSFKNGFNFNKGNLENGWKVLGVSNFQDYFYPNYENLEILVSDKLPSSEYLIEDNDILFVRSNGNKDLVGRTLLIKEPPFPITFSAFCIRGRFVNSKIDPLFFTFYSKSDLFKTAMKKLVQGTNITNVSQGLLSQLEVPLPPLEEQKEIAVLFQSLEKAIEKVEVQEKNLHLLLQNLINELLQENSKIRKSKVKKILFADIATNISERAEPQNSIGQIFVGLDHIDTREIKIERFGKPDSLIGTKLKVYEGDIIFGKRNAYLRKAAISTFNGICSAHAMVLRANERNIFKEYLPFFMHSDSFMLRAKEISEGSISPTIKWKNLEGQEFYIPEVEEQKSFTELFIRIERIRNQLKKQKTTLKNLKQKLLNEILG